MEDTNIDPQLLDNAEQTTEETTEVITETSEQTAEVAPATEEEDTTIESFYTAATGQAGLELSEDELAEIELGDNISTMTQITAKLVEKAREEGRNQVISSHPDLEKALLHLEAHGSLSNFNKDVKEEVKTFDVTTTEGMREAYTEYLRSKGEDPDDIEALVERAEDTGKLKDKALLADSYFKQKEEEAREEYNKRNLELIQQREAEAKQVQNDINSIISGGKVLGVPLLPNEKKAFLDYLYKPIDEQGRTAKDLADEQITLEQELYLEYLKMKQFKTVKQGESQVVKTLKDSFKKNAARVSPVGVQKSGDAIESTAPEIEVDEAYLKSTIFSNK